jgi:hypothetical protein
MESGGMAGKINVSDVTMDILQKLQPNRFAFTFNKEIAAKVIQRSHNSFFITEDNTSIL